MFTSNFKESFCFLDSRNHFLCPKKDYLVLPPDWKRSNCPFSLIVYRERPVRFSAFSSGPKRLHCRIFVSILRIDLGFVTAPRAREM